MAILSPQSVELLPNHFPVAESGKRNPIAESCPCSHTFLCYFCRIWHTYRDPGHGYIGIWVMWQKYSHLFHESRGEKVLPPMRAAPLSHCQLKQHSSAASPSLGMQWTLCLVVQGIHVPQDTQWNNPLVQGAASVMMSERSHSQKRCLVFGYCFALSNIFNISSLDGGDLHEFLINECFILKSACQTLAFSLSKPLELLSLLHNSFLQNAFANN